ncbi:MAG: hypothetical protein EON59_05430 [Alphaproteobacteria bacterium]|nr:MAG: hypothetical protein EON59_05430 [Alphaproteobacteria bacterium]
MATGFPGKPNEPFLWGRGGKRLTPEEVAYERQMAERQLAGGADYSPVGHWTQGLARVAEGLTGGLRLRDARKSNEANAAESRSVLEALLNPPAPVSPGAEVPTPGGNPQAGGINPAILSALSNPYIDDSTRKLAMQQYQTATKRAEPMEINGQLIDPTTRQVLGDYRTAPAAPDIIQLAQIANDPARPEFERKAAADRITALNDPIINVPLPGDRVFLGPRSGISALGNGGGAQPPATLPPDFDGFDKGGPTPSASGGFPR